MIAFVRTYSLRLCLGTPMGLGVSQRQLQFALPSGCYPYGLLEPVHISESSNDFIGHSN